MSIGDLGDVICQRQTGASKRKYDQSHRPCSGHCHGLCVLSKDRSGRQQPPTMSPADAVETSAGPHVAPQWGMPPRRRMRTSKN